jgi:hypothetical protein
MTKTRAIARLRKEMAQEILLVSMVKELQEGKEYYSGDIRGSAFRKEMSAQIARIEKLFKFEPYSWGNRKGWNFDTNEKISEQEGF